MTAPNGNIVFNNSTGSDVTASGLGPGTAKSGSAGSCTSASAVVTGIDTTGVTAGDLFFGDTSVGRKFSIISSVDSGTQVTLDDALTATHVGDLVWAVGGKRQTIDNADSRVLFTDWKDLWKVELQYTGTNYLITASAISVGVAASRANFATLLGSGAGRVVIEQQANTNHFVRSAAGTMKLDGNLQLICTNATKTAANALGWGDGLEFISRDVIFGSDTAGSRLNSAIDRASGSENRRHTFIDCQIINCVSTGLGPTAVSWTLEMLHCIVRDCAGGGIKVGSNNAAITRLSDCIVENNTGDGLLLNPDNFDGDTLVEACTFNGNTGDGIDSSIRVLKLILTRNNFTNNGNFGVRAASGQDVHAIFNDWNNYFNNTSGARSNLSAGTHDVAVDPQYADAANSNFTPANTATRLTIARPEGINTYEWIGAIQPAEGGLLRPMTMQGGLV